MAKKLRYPGWHNWQTGIESALKQAMIHSGITGYRINGAATDQHIAVKGPDQHLGSMPYVQAILSGVRDGWDDEMSGQEDYDNFVYTAIGGGKTVRSLNFVRERITWTIEGFAQKHEEVVKIAQVIKKYFNTLGTLQITWDEQDHPVFTKLHDFSLEAAEADRQGKIEFFRVSYLFTLSILSEQITPDLIQKSIAEVVVESATTIGGDEEDTETKTIS